MDNAWTNIEPCGDCGVNPGVVHKTGCDVARCKLCGHQEIQCSSCTGDREGTVWTGLWPGTIECIEYGLYSYWGPPWIECGPDHPGAGPDYNALARLHATGDLIWDSEQERLIRPSE